MFQEEYKKAYNKIEINNISVEELQSRLNSKNIAEKRGLKTLRTIMAGVVATCLFFTLALPVLAEQVPGVYRVIQRFAPGMAEYILPEEISCTSNDITLQVEAVTVTGKTAELIVSFKDAEGSEKNLICGRVELYDNYRIVNYGENGQIGGCSFLFYDEAEDKAYFKVDITSDVAFEKDKIKFVVNRLLTRYNNEEQKIIWENGMENWEEKIVESSGISGTLDGRSKIPFFVTEGGMTSRKVRVMDVAGNDASLTEDLRVTGVAYGEGVLRVQQCRGNFKNADRHIRFYLKDKDKNEKIPDASVSWQEEIGGEEVLFEETWFGISEDELEKYELYGMFYIVDENWDGNWEVIVRLEE